MSEASVTLRYITSDDPAPSGEGASGVGTRSIRASKPARQHPVNNLEGLDLRRLRLVAYQLTRNFWASHDIAQSICANLLAMSREKRNEIESLDAYAARAAKNAALNWLRAQDRNAPLSVARDLAAEGFDPFETVCAEDEVCRRLATLPARLRDPLILCALYGYQAKECAATLGISVEAVWKRVQRALELLQSREAKTLKSQIRASLRG